MAVSIAAVWIPSTIGDKFITPPWSALLFLSIGSGLMAAVLHPVALLAIAFYILPVYLVRSAQAKSFWNYAIGIIVVVITLALASHRIPGFNNPLVIGPLELSPGAVSFRQHANFDKAVAGLVLLAFVCKRVSSIRELRTVLFEAMPTAWLTMAMIFGLAFGTGHVQLDLKVLEITPYFLLINFFFTVIPEEAFFRGFLQERLSLATSRLRYGRLITVIVSAIAFGAVHAPGGLLVMLLATILGLGCSYAYHKSQRIEAPIILHFLANSVHFFTATYPQLA